MKAMLLKKRMEKEKHSAQKKVREKKKKRKRKKEEEEKWERSYLKTALTVQRNRRWEMVLKDSVLNTRGVKGYVVGFMHVTFQVSMAVGRSVRYILCVYGDILFFLCRKFLFLCHGVQEQTLGLKKWSRLLTWGNVFFDVLSTN